MHRTSQVLQLCPERGASLPLLVTAVHVRRAVFGYLNPEPRVTAYRRIQHSRYGNMMLDQRDSCQRCTLVSSSHFPILRFP